MDTQHPHSENPNWVQQMAYIKGFISYEEFMDIKLFKHMEDYFCEMTWPEGDGYGSSDFNADIASVLTSYGYEITTDDSSYIRKNGWEPEDSEKERWDRLEKARSFFS